MNVVQISPHDFQGGASRIAWYLHDRIGRNDDDCSHMLVGRKSLQDDNVIQLDHDNYKTIKLLWKLKKAANIYRGKENFHFPATSHLRDFLPHSADIYHAHNLQGKYFDLEQLPVIADRTPTLLTMHDNWCFTGHCSYFIQCERWMAGCGKCPDLNRSPTILKDATAFNLARKKRIFGNMKLNVATPSKWLLDEAKSSMLGPNIAIGKVINNGVDQEVFKPGDKQFAREKLSIKKDSLVLLYVVSSGMQNNSYKDYTTIEAALKQIENSICNAQAGKNTRNIVFVGVGGAGENAVTEYMERRFEGYISNPQELALYYQAADIYLHAANADTFPNVILESLACGTPVVATDVGGISEQVDEGETGYLVPRADAQLMATKVIQLMGNKDKLLNMAKRSAIVAKEKFTLDRMCKDYIDLYRELIDLA